MSADEADDSVGRVGDVALVTGGSRGIGRAVALQLAERGIAVCCTGRSSEDLQPVVAECADRGVRAAMVVADQRDRVAIKRSVRLCEDELGPITMLVNNAGVARPGRFLELSDDSLDDEFRMNLLGPVSYLREVGALMTVRERGAIVNVASNRAMIATTHLAAYSSAKAGLVHLTRCLAREWARYNVRVNAVCPGATATSLNEEARADPAVVDRVLRDIPVGRYALPTEVASLITYLLLPEAAMITGAAYAIDGGEAA